VNLNSALLPHRYWVELESPGSSQGRTSTRLASVALTAAIAAQRYLGGAGVVCAGPDPAADVGVGVRVGVWLVV
jgi:hypothetical protein